MGRLILPLLSALLFSALATAAAPTVPYVPTPRATLLPTSATNRPFLSAARTQLAVDLAARDYVEEEVLVSGDSSSYAWSSASRDGVTASDPAQPWTTRLLIRRPRDAAKFSGRVVLEVLDSSQTHDVAPLWGLSWEHFMRRGDAWAGLTVRPAAAQALQRFDPVRYAGVDFKPGNTCGTRNAVQGDALAWDLMAQAGVLLRSASRENPLSTLHPQRVVAAGFAQGGAYVTTFASALHARARLVGGGPVFDAYLSAGSMAAVPLDPCSGTNEPRRAAQSRDVPFIAVATQSDFSRSPLPRRADSDVRGEMFRLYEITGASHVGPYLAGLPAAADLQIAGLESPATGACRETASDFPMGYAFNAIWQQLDELLLKNEPMSSLPRIGTGPGGSPQLDERGNARGGFRLPHVDVPVAVYSGRSSPGQDDAQLRARCEVSGSMRAYDQARLRQLYRNREGYLQRFNAAVDAAVQERRLVAEDAATLKAPATRVLPVF